MAKDILIPILVLGGISLVFGIALILASKVFAVQKNELAEAIREVLPGANCGACGYPGCDPYALAVAEGESGTLCIPGGNSTAQAIGELLGTDVGEQKALVMRVNCCKNVTERYEYEGIESCAAAAMVYGGTNSCSYSCLGFGDCVAVCPYDAMVMKNGLPVIDPNLCTQCGLCAKACPRGILQYAQGDFGYFTACVSNDTARDTIKSCKNGCIACRLCEKACEYDAIHVIDNLAVFDYDKCVACGKCYEVCPKKIIHKFASSC